MGLRLGWGCQVYRGRREFRKKVKNKIQKQVRIRGFIQVIFIFFNSLVGGYYCIDFIEDKIVISLFIYLIKRYFLSACCEQIQCSWELLVTKSCDSVISQDVSSRDVSLAFLFFCELGWWRMQMRRIRIFVWVILIGVFGCFQIRFECFFNIYLSIVFFFVLIVKQRLQFGILV